ncbi:MAG TPA: COQ9 family protein [Caulobacteraceae bacterium]|jgi:ubiquinone biosynthesis protein COQ9
MDTLAPPAADSATANADSADSSDWASAAEARLLDAALGLAPDIGWTGRTIRLAARRAGLSEPEASLVLPNGASDLVALLWRRHDAQGMAALAEVDPRSLKVRERIGRAVQARVEAAADDAPATRRLQGWLALPHHMPLGARLLWDSADIIWRWAGDTATDENHYSKRAILSGVLGPAIAIRLASGRGAADDYVFHRIADVMAFEKWKAGLPKTDIGLQIAGALGKVRYGVRPAPRPEGPPPSV